MLFAHQTVWKTLVLVKLTLFHPSPAPSPILYFYPIWVLHKKLALKGKIILSIFF